MTGAIQYCIRAADASIARVYLSMFEERNALLTFLFHSIFQDEQEIEQNLIDPFQRITVTQFRQFIQYYVSHGYRFISPCDLLGGLQGDGKYAMITFDDGYYNNHRVLPILQEFGVPATFFVSTNHVLQSKAYWWDVLYRNRAKQGVTLRKIWQESAAFKLMKTERIEEDLIAMYGPDALRPQGDLDRPFSSEELKEFAQHPLVHVGNHSANHAIFTNYSADEIRAQIRDGQDAVEKMTGRRPLALAYPNGAFNDQIAELAAEMGVKIGFTVRPGKSHLPLEPNTPAMLRLGRFTPYGEAPIATQCRTYRSDLLFYGLFRDTYIRLRRRHAAY